MIMADAVGVVQASTIAGYQNLPPELKAKLLAALQKQQGQSEAHQPGTMPTEVRRPAACGVLHLQLLVLIVVRCCRWWKSS